MVAHSPDANLKKMVSSNSLKNYPVKVNDFTNARDICGPYLSGLGDRTTRQKVMRVESECMGIPWGL